MTVETDPIRVFAEDGKWLVDYGSYAHGYHSSRSEVEFPRFGGHGFV